MTIRSRAREARERACKVVVQCVNSSEKKRSSCDQGKLVRWPTKNAAGDCFCVLGQFLFDQCWRGRN